MVAVLAVAWRRRPGGRRIGGLPRPSRPVGVIDLSSLPEQLGRFVRVRVGRGPDPSRDRPLGWTILAAVGLALIQPLLVPGAASIWLANRWRARELARRRELRLVDEAPEVVDLLLLAVEAGCTPRLALQATGAWSVGAWGEAIAAVLERIGHGERLSEALPGLDDRLGDVARPLVVALLDTEHYGVPLLPALHGLAGEMRVERDRRAEERARRVPVRLLFPLVFCTLPAFVVLTIVPLLAGTLPTLST
jgi:tight adherence protein C